MASGEPPKDIPPERLFRTLLQLPRASVDLEYRLPAAPDIELRVCALTSAEISEALSFESSELPEELRSGEAFSRLIEKSLFLASGEPAFSSYEQVGLLAEDDMESLAKAVFVALDRVSPTFVRSNFDLWLRALEKGAKHMSNFQTAQALGSCIDSGYSSSMPRPDVFFGVPLKDLTDGHWMAYYASRKVVEEGRKQK